MFQSKEIEWLTVFKKKKPRPIFMLPRKHTSEVKIHRRLKEREWKETFQVKGNDKKGGGSNTHITQNRLSNKIFKKRQRRALHMMK